MPAEPEEYTRNCPGEEAAPISDAVCLGRRRANYHKCPGCPFNDDEKGSAAFVDRVVRQRPHKEIATVREDELRMIEKVFKAYDVRATVPEPLNEEVAWRIGNATAQFLRTSLTGYARSEPEMNRLIVGRDMRTHSPTLSQAFMEGVAASGTPVVDIGMIDTSQIAFATNYLKCCGGVQTTASHNPADYNGFKISGPGGRPIGVDSGLQEIARIAAAISYHRVRQRESVERVDLAEPYRAYLREFLRPIRPLKVVVDASNGMAGRWFPIVFGDVENLEFIPLNFEHDGTFVHPPNPLVPANLQQLRAAVREQKVDFGACFDGDADRCIFVDEHAAIVGCDLLTALLAGEYLRDNRGAAIAYDLRSSRIVPETIRSLGGVPKRSRVGHVYMKRALAEEDGVFGGELSGHFYFRDFWYCDSALMAFIAVLNVMTRSEQSLSALLRPLQKYVASGERNFVNDDKKATFRRLEEKYDDAEIDHLDGVTVQYPRWWFNLRPSNTEPLLRLNLEAESQKLVDQKLAELAPLLGEPAAEH